MEIETIEKYIKEIKDEVQKVIKGKESVIEKVIMAMMAGGHILLEDVPGLGKTTLVKTFSKALGFENKRIQFTPDTMPSDIVGMSIFNEQIGKFEYVDGAAVNCNILLGDEINRTSSKTQSALLEAMAEGKVTVDGVTHELLKPFVVLATQNPITSGGTQPLPDSQLDRFMVKLSMGYPDRESQLAILKNISDEDILDKVDVVLSVDKMIEIQNYVRNMSVSDEVLYYIIELCEKTREVSQIQLGVSPRGVAALTQMAKANAVCMGRSYVVPDDVKNVFYDCLSHRIILSMQARHENIMAQDVLGRILNEVKAPELLRK